MLNEFYGAVIVRIVKSILVKAENIIGVNEEYRPYSFCDSGLPYAEGIIYLPYDEVF